MSNHLTRPIKMEADMEMNCDSADEDSMLQTDIIGQLESGSGLGMMNSLDSGTEMLSQNMGFMMENGEDPENDENILMQHMDIRDPLSTLKELLEQRIGIELEGYEFWLQDAQMLEAHKNLVDQCVQGKGLVQINVQIRTLSKRINIVDVLKPHDEYADVSENGDGSEEQDGEQMVPEQTDDDPDIDSDPDKQTPNTVIKWLVDEQFKKDQQRLSIPEDPMMWSIAHVRHWLQWAVRQFHLANIKTRDWNISGHTLCNLTLREFQRKVPSDPGNVFWTHLELLRKCKFVAILQKDTVEDQMPAIIRKSPKGALRKPVKPASGLDFTALPEFPPIAGNKSGNNGQVQLWQFLLEILTEKEYRSAIQWVGADGEFKLNNPEYVAQLWGHRKNKPMMNYEKLSRALRYYYDGDMISKVHGKRFVYKFVCDLKQLLGYDAAELANLVNQTTNTNSVHYLW